MMISSAKCLPAEKCRITVCIPVAHRQLRAALLATLPRAAPNSECDALSEEDGVLDLQRLVRIRVGQRFDYQLQEAASAIRIDIREGEAERRQGD